MAKKSASVSTAVKETGKLKNSSKQTRVKTFSWNGSHYSKDRIGKLLIQAHELAWAGQHAKAIALATQELSRSSLKPDIQIDLLDPRAESYIAIGNLDLAAKDANAMVKLAKGKSGCQPDLPAKTLNRKALVQMRTGDLKGVEKAVSALKAFQGTRQKPFIAQSFFRLCEAQFRNLNYLREGEFFGEVAALTGMTRTANIITEEDREFLILPSKVMQGLAKKYPRLSVMLHTLTGERLSQTELPRGTGFDQQLLRHLRTSQPVMEAEPASV